MTYQDEIEQTATLTTSQVLAAFAAYLAGTLTLEALTEIAAVYVAAGNAAAASLADLSLAAAVSVQIGQPVAPLGITRPPDDADRLARGVRTIAEDLDRLTTEAAADLDAEIERARMRLQRLADAEVRKAGADAYSEATRRSRHVTGWTRGREPDACQLCTWWWRDGRVWPADHPMPTHTGCTCSQLVTTTDQPIREVRY